MAKKKEIYDIGKAIDMLDEGYTMTEVGEYFGMSRRTAKRRIEEELGGEIYYDRVRRGGRRRKFPEGSVELNRLHHEFANGKLPEIVSKEYKLSLRTIKRYYDEWIDAKTTDHYDYIVDEDDFYI